MTTEVEKAYAKGYAAGQRRLELADRAADRVSAENAFWRAVFCAALQGTLGENWQTGNKRWNDFPSYVKGCGQFADEALRQHRGRA
jgi:hypothetical protein